MTLMLTLKMQYLANKEKLKFLILRHVKSVGEQVLNQAPFQKIVQHVEVADKLEELLEHLLEISHKLLNVLHVMELGKLLQIHV